MKLTGKKIPVVKQVQITKTAATKANKLAKKVIHEIEERNDEEQSDEDDEEESNVALTQEVPKRTVLRIKASKTTKVAPATQATRRETRARRPSGAKLMQIDSTGNADEALADI